MSRRKWWVIFFAGIIGSAVWVAKEWRNGKPSPEDTAATFIRQAAFREATSQTKDSATPVSEGMTAGEYQRLCAVNCLYFVNRLHGIHSTYEDVKSALQPGEIGVSIGHLAEVASAYGYHVTPVRLSRREMCEISDTMIVLASPAEGPQAIGHFGVVVPVPSRKGCWVFDPPRKKMWVSRDEIKEKNQKIPALRLKQPQ